MLGLENRLGNGNLDRWASWPYAHWAEKRLVIMLPTRRVVLSESAMRDVESATTAPGAPKPSVKKMCLIFGIVIMIWFAVLVYIISGVKAPDRQSYYMDNLDFKASSVATPSSHAHPHPTRRRF